MLLKIWLLTAILSLFYSDALCVEYNPEILENILERVSFETGSSPELDAIEKYIETPICLKQTTINEFLAIPGFTTSEAKRIIEMAKADSIMNFPTLFGIVKLSEEQKYLLSYCTSLNDKECDTGREYLFWRIRNKNYLNKVSGFEEGKFKGSALDLYQRISVYYDNFSFGLLTDKDGGEQKLADFYSGYFSGGLAGFQFIFGDYYLETGLGNLLWKSFALRKGAEVLESATRKGSGLMPYRSSLDYRYFRGLAVEKKFDLFGSNINTIIWYSKTKRPGTIDTSGDIVESVYQSGYYRTDSEISKKNAFNEISTGANLELSVNNLSFGFTILRLDYNKEIISDAKNAFYGKKGNLLSVYSMIDFNNSSLGAEVSSDAKGNIGIKTGTEMNFGELGLAMHLRSFTKNFRSPFGNNFGESYAPNNEYGIYTGLKYSGFDNFVISSYIDLYSTYDITYFVPDTIKGIDIFVQSEWIPDDKTEILFRLQVENKTDAITTGDEKNIFQKTLGRIRVEYQKHLNKDINVKLRTEAVYVNFEKIVPDETGISGFLDISWLPFKKMKTGFRLSVFSSESYESAMWQFEMALPGYMTTTPLYGDGVRFFTYLNLNLFDKLSISTRYALTKKNNVKSLGSGYLEIDGNIDQRLIFQLDLKI